ncbi:MAG: UDP-4-amino-4,6-dideoxy-N-acetyl-beta-L-altrosamine transaminase [Gemmatimonadota bacterium]
MLPYGRQEISDADVAAVSRALRAPFLTQGPGVAEFEDRLAASVGARFAVAFNSGTAALHGAYAAAGIGPGKRVLTSPITFVATANAAVYLGGDVAFADVSPDTALLDPAAAARAGGGIAVIAPVHLTGEVADLERLSRLAAERGWIVVEDAAHALGATYRTRDGATHQVGACRHSAMCCLSFHPVKHITTGEGGAVTTNDASLAHAMRRFRSHGITRDPAELSRDEGPWYYEQVELGFNYRLTDIQCALGTSQLARLDDFVARRRAVAARYDDALRGIEGVTPLARPEWSTGSFHLYVVQVPGGARRAVFESMRERGIGVNVHYIPVHRQPYYQARGWSGPAELPNAERYYAGAITLPLFPAMTPADVTRVAAALAESLEGAPA